jgi:hypothetical protein
MAEHATESNALSVREEQSTELATSHMISMAKHEIETSMVVSQKFPRNEDDAYGRLMKSCMRPAFAEMALYAFPRGGKQITGPSIKMAIEMARTWKHIRWGVDILHDDDEKRTIRAWAWDMQENTKVTADDTFKKLIYRKKGGWIKPDERDLRELHNRRGALAVRNCLLQLMPPDFIDEAKKQVRTTVEQGIAGDDPDKVRKAIIRAFSSVGVTVEDLERYLSHDLAKSTTSEIANLRGVYKSLADGNCTWSDYVTEPTEPVVDDGAVTLDDLTGTSTSKQEGRTKGRKGKKTDPPSPDATKPERVADELFDKAQTATESGQ